MQQSYQFVAQSSFRPGARPAFAGRLDVLLLRVELGFPAGLECFHMQDDQPSYVNGVYTAGRYDERRLRRFRSTGSRRL